MNLEMSAEVSTQSYVQMIDDFQQDSENTG